MNCSVVKSFPHTPFSVQTEQVKNEPGTWNSTKVSIFRDETLIGEYLRNYSGFGTNTFYPFELDSQWYALYSANYTATRVMKLHEDKIEDWCGEESSAHGFCPVEFYVPKYIHSKHELKSQLGDSEYDSYTVDCDCSPEDFESELNTSEFINLNHCNFAFMCGCVWGDDTSWKLRYIDLSQVPNKVLSVTEKFGYWELPDSLTLRESIKMDGWEPGHNWIKLYRAESLNLKTDERC